MGWASSKVCQSSYAMASAVSIENESENVVVVEQDDEHGEPVRRRVWLGSACLSHGRDTQACAYEQRSAPPVNQTCSLTTMTSIGTGYDLSASTYSPDGRIFQVRRHPNHFLRELIHVCYPGRVC